KTSCGMPGVLLGQFGEKMEIMRESSCNCLAPGYNQPSSRWLVTSVTGRRRRYQQRDFFARLCAGPRSGPRLPGRMFSGFLATSPPTQRFSLVPCRQSQHDIGEAEAPLNGTDPEIPAVRGAKSPAVEYPRGIDIQQAIQMRMKPEKQAKRE